MCKGTAELGRNATQSRGLDSAGNAIGIGIQLYIKSYQHKNDNVSFLREVRLQIRGGSRACLLGASGAGKTTILTILAGLAHGQLRGTVCYNFNESLLSPEQLRRRGWLGFLSQRPALLPWLSVRRNLEFPATTCPALSMPKERDLVESLTQLALRDNTLDLMPGQLSGGMHQRVAVARTLLYRPRVVLMDEALNALDSASADIVMRALSEYANHNAATLVLVTHDTERALRYSEDVYFLSTEGQLEIMPCPFIEHKLHARLAHDIGLAMGDRDMQGDTR